MKTIVSRRYQVSNRWTVLITVFICGLLVYGIRHSFSAFFPYILDEFGWPRGSTALIFALSVVMYGILAPLSGNIAGRWKPELMISAGILLVGVSASACVLANELWHFYLLFGLIMPIGIAFAGMPVLVPALTNWFTSKRGMILGFGIAGGGLSFSMPTYAELLIANFGWRLAFVIMSATVTTIVIPMALLFFRYRPKNQLQKSSKAVEALPGIVSEKDLDDRILMRALKSYRLWLLVISYMLFPGVASFMIIAHQVVFFSDLGYSSGFAASIAGVVGVFMAVGTLSGFVSDRIGRERALLLATVLSICSIIILLYQSDTSSAWILYVYAFCFGISMGIFGPTIVAGAADLFHSRHFGVVNGLLLMGFGLGGAVGPWLGGYIFDITGSYNIAFIICIVCYGVSCISFWIAAPRKVVKIQ